MLPFLIHWLSEIFSKDKSPEALEKMHSNLENEITGMRGEFIAKVFIISAIILGLFFLFQYSSSD